MRHPFELFLEQFVPLLEKKSTQLNKMSWILETTGSQDAADLKADLDAELRVLFSDPSTYGNLIKWDRDPAVTDPLLKRQLNVLIRSFKQNQIPKQQIEEIAQKEARLAHSYAQFRPELNGRAVSENDIRHILTQETNVEKRRQAWEASKVIGQVLAPQILHLVQLRNEAAKSLGYADFFQMQLDLQEVESKWLLQTLDDLSQRSDAAYATVVREIEKSQSERFGVPIVDLGPWAWSEPFCQEDPLDSKELDRLVDGVDLVAVSTEFYERMGLDVRGVLARSDMKERPGKNQHAFCTHIDRRGDVRTLNNVKSTLKWLETILHELGHAVYDLGFKHTLPWLLKEPPHMIPTEAMALLAGRQAYTTDSLPLLVGISPEKALLIAKAAVSLKRRQLIFSRWVLVMTAFESELYRDPLQDLNVLWWDCVEKYQKVRRPKGREGKWDFATKYHLGLAPVYYFSYLLGEMFASAIVETLHKECGSQTLSTPKSGRFLQEKLFAPGDRMPWSALVKHVTGKPLTADAWLREFA